MAIGTLAAIGLGLGAVGSVVGGNAANKAAGKAADTSLAVAEKNNALARETYAKNEGYLTPSIYRGDAAGGAINALLGLSGGGDGTYTVKGNPGTVDWNRYISAQPDVAYDRTLHMDMSPEEYGKWHYAQDGSRRDLGLYTTGATADQTLNAGDAFNNYKKSTGYDFRLKQGFNALNSGWAGSGSLKSGAAGKAFVDYGQNAASGEFSNYMGLLANQQGVGLSGASALAGVGQNYVNNVSANNNSAGSAAANALLARGANNPFGNALSMLGGGLYGYGR